MSLSPDKDIQYTGFEIAIIGMAGKFPGAQNINMFWENLRNGKETISFFSKEELMEMGLNEQISKPNFVPAKGYIEDIEYFDNDFFNFSPFEAKVMDPQLRLLHECSWHALEDSAHVPGKCNKTIGVYLGGETNLLWTKKLTEHLSEEQLMQSKFLNGSSYFSTKISYNFNLHGPSFTIQTACSSSLVAVHLACCALLSGECNMALAGGVTINLPQKSGYFYKEGLMYSPDGHCRPFDNKANGTIFSDGVGVVVLKPLEDAIKDRDNIYAIIKGSATNNDGNRKVGFTAPSVEGQVRVIKSALKVSGVEAESISYIEAHGTGTKLGDPIEIEALNQVYGNVPRKILIGSVKGNIGHLFYAAGIASLIKTALSLKNREITASINFDEINKNIDLDNTPFIINTKLTKWEKDRYPLRASVSSFGIGGTNANLILEQAPNTIATSVGKSLQPICLSAKTQEALDELSRNILVFLKDNTSLNLADIAYTLNKGREHFLHRRFLQCENINDAIDKLSNPSNKNASGLFNKKKRVVFVLPGQGSLYVNMAKGLYVNNTIFQKEIDSCFKKLERICGKDLKQLLFPQNSESGVITNYNNEEIYKTQFAQPIIFICEYALGKLLFELDVRPDFMIGHSIGEYVAACLSGVISLDDAIEVVYRRAQLMQRMEPGSMLNIQLPEEKIQIFLTNNISIAAINSPDNCTVAGSVSAISSLSEKLKEQKYIYQELNVSHAFHSDMMYPVANEIKEIFKNIKLNNPKIPYYSNVTGQLISSVDLNNPDYWSNHLINKVLFSKGIDELIRIPDILFVEVGPATLIGFINKQTNEKGITLLSSPKNYESDYSHFISGIGNLWMNGIEINWKNYYADEIRRFLSLPTYPFQKKKLWLEESTQKIQGKDSSNIRLQMENWFYVPSWKKLVVTNNQKFSLSSKNIVVMIDENSESIVNTIKEAGNDLVVIRKGASFYQKNEKEFFINPVNEADYSQLFESLHQQNIFPAFIFHFWMFSDTQVTVSETTIDSAKNLGYYCLLYMARALYKCEKKNSINISFIGNHIFNILGEESIQPEKSLLIGPVNTISKEYDNIRCKLIDVEIDLFQNNTNWVFEQVLEIQNITEIIVSIRGKSKWAYFFEEVKLSNSREENSLFKMKGVYVITGGLGGLGLEVAKFLGGEYKAKLVLIGRNGIPERTKWQEILEENSNSDLKDIIIKLIDIEKNGGEVELLSLDISNEKASIEAFKKIINTHGQINGVIHCAGVNEEGLMHVLSNEKSELVFKPKVSGVLIMHEFFKDVEIDFFLNFSSLNSILAPIGQVAYSSANNFMDAFSAYQNRIGINKILTINWDGWQKTGMAARASVKYGNLQNKEFEESTESLKGYIVSKNTEQAIYVNQLTKSHWVFNEHNIFPDKSTFPGTAYLELTIANLEPQINNQTIVFKDVFFSKQLHIKDSEKLQVYTIFSRKTKGYEFKIISKNLQSNSYQNNAIGSIALDVPILDKKHDISSIIQQCSEKEYNFSDETYSQQKKYGPRWHSCKFIKSNDSKAIAYIELNSQFENDLNAYYLHPALFDVATGFISLTLPKDKNHLPYHYKEIIIKRKLPKAFYSYVELVNSKSSNKLIVNVLVLDTLGNEIIAIKDYTLLGITNSNKDEADNQFNKVDKDETPQELKRIIENGTIEHGFLQSEKKGVLPEEGIEIIKKSLSSGLEQIIVSTSNLTERLKNSPKLSDIQKAAELTNVRDNNFLLKSNLSESADIFDQLKEIYKNFFGLQSIDIEDDFFELGGDSLQAVFLASKLNEILGLEVVVTDIFEYPKIKNLGEYLSNNSQLNSIKIDPVETKDYYPVSSGQARLYILNKLESEAVYNQPVITNIHGVVNVDKVRSTLIQLVQRHESLRTSFHILGSQLCQIIHDSKKVELVFRHKEMPFAIDENIENNSQIEQYIESFTRKFDLSKAPLFRCELISFSETRHLLLFDIHHIIFDRMSIQLIMNEFQQLYNNEILERIKLQYKDFANWQNKLNKTQKFEVQKNYWLNRFKDPVPLLNLQTDYPRPKIKTGKGARVKFYINEDSYKKINMITTETSSTLFMYLMSVYYIFLSKLSGQSDIVIGFPISERKYSGFEKVIGMFVNTIALRNHPSYSKNFLQFLNEVKSSLIDAYKNADYQFEDLIEKLSIARDLGRNVLFDAMFVLQNSFKDFKVEGLNFTTYNYYNKISKFDLLFEAIEHENYVEMQLEYSTDLFNRDTIERWTNCYLKILDEILHKPTINISDINIVPIDEQRKILQEFNNTKKEYAKEINIRKAFELQCLKTPNAIALRFNNIQLTYEELNNKSNLLAKLLISKGVKRNTLVGIKSERSIEMIVGIFGILKAGGGYLPIDPNYPDQRIEFIIRDSGVKLLLTSGETKLSGFQNIEIINIESINDSQSSNDVLIENNPHDIAYSIYTSGSTGKPKGVLIEHYSLMNRLLWMKEQFNINTKDVLILKTPYTFDVSVWEIFLWVLGGSSLSILPPTKEKEPDFIANTIERENVSIIHFVPSMMNIFLQYIASSIFSVKKVSSLKYVISSGEALSLGTVKLYNDLLLKNNKTSLFNLYGPTEATIDVSSFDCSSDGVIKSIPIGKPIDNIELIILDSFNQLTPIGVAGDLYIAGDGLARGYLNRPELTHDKFSHNPLFKKVLYHTGDLARWLPDGNIDFLGRNDFQVKIRGNRIELGEVESCLLQIDGIKEVFICSIKDKHENTDLIAYYTAEKEISNSKFQNHLRNFLPDYMAPAYFVYMEKFPLTQNGKINRNLLPKPEIVSINEYQKPETEIEIKLIEIWSELLGRKKGEIGVNSNFFSIGGHSLTANLLIAQIHKSFNVILKLKEIFIYPTVKLLAVRMKTAIIESCYDIKKVEEKEYYNVSSAQKRMFITQFLDKKSTAYNMPVVLKAKGPLKVEKFQQTINLLIQRHENLRTIFKLVNGYPVQIVKNNISLNISQVFCEVNEIDKYIDSFCVPFNLSEAPLFRVSLLITGELEHIILFDIHHILFDGYSVNILIKEIADLYCDKNLPVLSFQYKDFSEWQEKRIAKNGQSIDEQYWKLKLGGDLQKLELPNDFPRPKIFTYKGDRFQFKLDIHKTLQLKDLAKKENVTMNTLLLTFYNIFISKITSQQDIIVGCPIAGRNYRGLESIIGMFVNTIPLRSFISSDKTFKQLLYEVKENFLEDLDHSNFEFEDLVEKLKIKRDLSCHPVYQTSFVYVYDEISKIAMDDVVLYNISTHNKTTKFDLTFYALESNDGLIFSIEYYSDLFSKAIIKNFSQYFLSLIELLTQKPKTQIKEINIPIDIKTV